MEFIEKNGQEILKDSDIEENRNKNKSIEF